MIKNYLKTAWRSLARNKTFSFINIGGLAVGIACAGLIFLWVENELKYDNVNIKKNNLYSVVDTWLFSGRLDSYERSAGPLAAAMKTEMPGVANTCRYSGEPEAALIEIGDRKMYASGVYADSSVFSMLTMPFVQGNAANVFKQLYSIVITQKTAVKFFGDDKNIVGRTVRINNAREYVVSGVIRDFPQNTTLQFEWIAPFDVFLKDNERLNHWQSNSILTLVELKDHANIDVVNSQLRGYTAKKLSNNTVTSMLFSMNDWHLRRSFENGKLTGGGNIQYVWLFTLIAWIILLLACINFMNLATARSVKRAKEVGVRKVLGSGQKGLIVQFISEAMLMSAIAVALALFIIILILPGFNILTQKQLSLDLLSPVHFFAAVIIVIVCGLVSGSYPSLYLSSFNPVFVLKGFLPKSGNATFTRKGLVVLQFTISTVLIIGTIIIYQQIQYLENRDIGYAKNNLLVIPSNGNTNKSFEVVKNDLFNTGAVESAALANHEIIDGGQNDDNYTWKGKDVTSKVLISARGISPDLFKTIGIKLMQGRSFDANPDFDKANIIISESLAKMMKVKNVIGETITQEDRQYHIIGVTHDFIYGDMFSSKSDPLIFYKPNVEDNKVMYVRLKSGYNPALALAKVGMVFKKYNLSYPFTFKFADDEFNQLFLNEMLLSKLSRIFAALAIIISCLGLFGLTAYTAEQRTREIGIRKVLGANTASIAGLLTKGFMKLIFISSVIAFPIAWYLMNNWLLNYAYRITINLWIFALSGMAAMFIALTTISYQAVRAALINPVKSLKTE